MMEPFQALSRKVSSLKFVKWFWNWWKNSPHQVKSSLIYHWFKCESPDQVYLDQLITNVPAWQGWSQWKSSFHGFHSTTRAHIKRRGLDFLVMQLLKLWNPYLILSSRKQNKIQQAQFPTNESSDPSGQWSWTSLCASNQLFAFQDILARIMETLAIIVVVILERSCWLPDHVN